MNKNGFIATSLIYSFFLIFVTLFLTIIADYLQDKVLLNTIEKGIKDEINNNMSIEDFEVGDVLFFDNSMTGKYEYYKNKQWIVARINYDYNTISNSELVLYSFNVEETSDMDDKLYFSDINEDLSFGYFNNTYLKKMISAFEGEYFDLINKNDIEGEGSYTYYKIKTTSTNCLFIENNVLTTTCEESTPLEEGKYKFRIRKELTIGTDRLTINKDSGDSTIINIIGVAS